MSEQQASGSAVEELRRARDARTFLYSGPFEDDWTEKCLELAERHRAHCAGDLEVLLPTDIQAEDYAPHAPVHYGDEAELRLKQLMASPPSRRRLVIFVDFAPDLLPGDELLIQPLCRTLESWPEHLTLVVAAPQPHTIRGALFDREAAI